MDRDAHNLKRLFDSIYGPDATKDKYSVDELVSNFSEDEQIVIEDYLSRLSQFRLLSVSTFQRVVQRTPRGKQAFDEDCVCEIVLGEAYVDAKYRNAVFHVIVEKNASEETGGTAFFSGEFPNSLITARHVIDMYPVLRLEDHEGNILAAKICTFKYPNDPKLDLGVITLQNFSPTDGFRIAWDSVSPGIEFGSFSAVDSSGRRGEKVWVFGFPPTPWHRPSLYRFEAEIESRALDYSGYESLILSKSRPGCSGGPVIDYRGMVVGIVSDSNHRAEDSSGAVTEPRAKNLDRNFVAAVPSGYLSEMK